MKTVNLRAAMLAALALMLGVFLGATVCGNLILTICLPIAMTVAGIIFFVFKGRAVAVFYFCVALGLSAFAVDCATVPKFSGGEVSASVRVCADMNGYYRADEIVLDGKKQSGKLILYTSESLELGDEITFRCYVERLSVDFFSFSSTSNYGARIYFRASPSEVERVGSRVTVFEAAVRRMTEPMSKFMDSRDAAIAKSLLFGDKSQMTHDDYDAASAAGISHVFALSGLHVGFLVGLVVFLSDRLKIGKRAQAIILALLLLVYGLVTGFPSGLKRAAIMTLCTYSATLLGAKRDPLNTLGAACFIIVLTNPRELFELSFIMSLAAVAGIILFHAPMASLLRGVGSRKSSLRRYISDGTALTLSANVFMFPILCGVFNSLSVYAVIANLLILPIMGITFSLLAVSALLTLIFSGFGCLYYVVQFPIILIRLICEFISVLPFSTVEATALGVSSVFYVLIFVVLSRFVNLEKRTKALTVCVLSVIGCITFVLL